MLIGSVASAQQTRTGRLSTDDDDDKSSRDDPQVIQLEEPEQLVIPRGLDAPIDPDTYIIGPGDEFMLFLRGQGQQSVRLTVMPEGTVLVPNVGPHEAAGKTIATFRKELKKELGNYYRNVQIDVQLVKPRSFIIYVFGEVKSPGAVEVHAPARAGSALLAAGGLSDFGGLRAIELRENGETVRTLDAYKYWQHGDLSQNPVLKEGQVLFVPIKGAEVFIRGEVRKGGGYELRDGETVSDLFRFAGGTTSGADLSRVMLERLHGDQSVSVENLTEGELDTFELQDLDQVIVPDKKSFSETNYILVSGGGGREGKIYIEEGESLQQMLPRLIRFREGYNLEGAVLEREDSTNAIQYTPINLEKAFDGEVDYSDLILEGGDIISIPEEANVVYVTGLVANPGPVEFQWGLHAERYIALAGGPTGTGDLNKLHIFSAEGGKRSGDVNSAVYRGDTILVRRKTSAIFGAVLIGAATLTSLVLSIVAVSK